MSVKQYILILVSTLSLAMLATSCAPRVVEDNNHRHPHIKHRHPKPYTGDHTDVIIRP